MDKKIILGLVGLLSCGKEATKRYLAEKYNAKDCKYSTILSDILKRANIPISRENLQKISTVLRQNFGEDLLAKAIAVDASVLDSNIIVIDGVRRLEDIEYLVKLPNFFLIRIEAELELRYKRQTERGEKVDDKEKTFGQFIKDHEAEADRLIPEVMKTANYSIDNNGTLEDLHKQVDEIIEEILNK